MKTITLTASFDGEHIRLEENYPLPKNARLLVMVLPDGYQADLTDWRHFSAQGLERCYSSDEPEYTLKMVRESNPDYEAR